MCILGERLAAGDEPETASQAFKRDVTIELDHGPNVKASSPIPNPAPRGDRPSLPFTRQDQRIAFELNPVIRRGLAAFNANFEFAAAALAIAAREREDPPVAEAGVIIWAKRREAHGQTIALESETKLSWLTHRPSSRHGLIASPLRRLAMETGQFLLCRRIAF